MQPVLFYNKNHFLKKSSSWSFHYKNMESHSSGNIMNINRIQIWNQTHPCFGHSRSPANRFNGKSHKQHNEKDIKFCTKGILHPFPHTWYLFNTPSPLIKFMTFQRSLLLSLTWPSLVTVKRTWLIINFTYILYLIYCYFFFLVLSIIVV